MLGSIHQVKMHQGCALPRNLSHLFCNHLCQPKFHHTVGRVTRGNSEQKAECPKARVCQMSKDYLASEAIPLATARIDTLFWVKWAGILNCCALIWEMHTRVTSQSLSTGTSVSSLISFSCDKLEKTIGRHSYRVIQLFNMSLTSSGFKWFKLKSFLESTDIKHTLRCFHSISRVMYFHTLKKFRKCFKINWRSLFFFLIKWKHLLVSGRLTCLRVT